MSCSNGSSTNQGISIPPTTFNSMLIPAAGNRNTRHGNLEGGCIEPVQAQEQTESTEPVDFCIKLAKLDTD